VTPDRIFAAWSRSAVVHDENVTRLGSFECLEEDVDASVVTSRQGATGRPASRYDRRDAGRRRS
jgi:predicted ArsR family transcriptional regulator